MKKHFAIQIPEELHKKLEELNIFPDGMKVNVAARAKIEFLYEFYQLHK